MTDKEKLEAIRAEIHRLIEVRGYDREMANDLFAFMDSLPNEPVSEKKCMYAGDNYTDEDRKALCDGCKEECKFNKKEYSVNNGLDLGCGVIWRDEEPVSEELEEAANNTVIALVPSFGQKYSDGSYVSSCKDCFNREELLELFKAGANWKEQKLMAKTVDGTAMPNDAELWLESQNDLKEFAEGEEVKVIVIKKDEL